ncbi:MAG TPA: cell division protein SepF [Candidatus Butyricicoccus avistercoris]|uniref:Cell division protein SepF n=1 Tax=Candidatus Butyricicoccus avistercoris TaxID=2838518 RepID=A0A9D1PI45_9FIRM|nr:cell division protein SepF [Candidatus Butyricicoccus avistercoris]
MEDDYEDYAPNTQQQPQQTAQAVPNINQQPQQSQPAQEENFSYNSNVNYNNSNYNSTSDSQKQNSKVVSMHSTTQLAVVLVKPDRFENAAEIADHLKEKRTVVLNLEQTNKEVARRLVDFLSGVAYANEGKIKRVANSTYIITPYNVDILGDLLDELESNGLYL